MSGPDHDRRTGLGPPPQPGPREPGSTSQSDDTEARNARFNAEVDTWGEEQRGGVAEFSSLTVVDGMLDKIRMPKSPERKAAITGLKDSGLSPDQINRVLSHYGVREVTKPPRQRIRPPQT